MKEREELKQLISLWTDYLDAENEADIDGFADWLKMRNQKEKKLSEEQKGEQLAIKMELGHHLGRIINFTDLWGKLAFKDLPIRQFEDFGILHEVNEKGNPSKMEVAKVLVNEKSTAIERIKRLVRADLLVESLDENDRRIRRLSLTAKGREVLGLAYQQATKVAQLITAPLATDQVNIMLQHFRQLDRFHTDIYDQGNFNQIDDLIE